MDGPTCVKCRQVHEPGKCTGHAKNPDGSRRPCKNPPIRGAPTCRKHGSAAPQVRAAAEKRVTAEKAEAEARRLLGTAQTGKDPRLALLEEVWRTAGVVAWYEQEIQNLDRLSVLTERGESAHFLVSMHHTERRHLARTAKLAVDAGIQQELLDLAKEAADRFARALDGVLASLGHDPADPKVRDVVATQLRLVTSA